MGIAEGRGRATDRHRRCRAPPNVQGRQSRGSGPGGKDGARPGDGQYTARGNFGLVRREGPRRTAATRIGRLRRSARPRITAVPWQTLPHRLTTAHLARLEREVLLLHDDQVHADGAAAMARFVGFSSAFRYRLLATTLGLPGLRTCARRLYALVAANRHRLNGATASCAVARS